MRVMCRGREITTLPKIVMEDFLMTLHLRGDLNEMKEQGMWISGRRVFQGTASTKVLRQKQWSRNFKRAMWLQQRSLGNEAKQVGRSCRTLLIIVETLDSHTGVPGRH